MWAATSACSPSPSCRRGRRLLVPTRPPPAAVSAKSQPQDESTTPGNNSAVKSLGHTILSAVPKSPHPNPKQTIPKQESAAAAAGQISGSDVLRALQKAVAVKEKSRSRQVKDKKKLEGPPSADPQSSGINRRVRPLKINADWGLRLSELEKHLQEISETLEVNPF